MSRKTIATGKVLTPIEIDRLYRGYAREHMLDLAKLVFDYGPEKVLHVLGEAMTECAHDMITGMFVDDNDLRSARRCQEAAFEVSKLALQFHLKENQSLNQRIVS